MNQVFNRAWAGHFSGLLVMKSGLYMDDHTIE